MTVYVVLAPLGCIARLAIPVRICVRPRLTGSSQNRAAAARMPVGQRHLSLRPGTIVGGATQRNSEMGCLSFPSVIGGQNRPNALALWVCQRTDTGRAEV